MQETILKSLLFVPGDSDKKIAKAQGSGASALILDLEDSVLPDNKDSARARCSCWVAGYSRAEPLLPEVRAQRAHFCRAPRSMLRANRTPRKPGPVLRSWLVRGP